MSDETGELYHAKQNCTSKMHRAAFSLQISTISAVRETFQELPPLLLLLVCFWIFVVDGFVCFLGFFLDGREFGFCLGPLEHS